MSSTLVKLQWNEHSHAVASLLDALQSEGLFQDVTLCCEGHLIRAHKTVLGLFSAFFEDVFQQQVGSHPTIVLHNVPLDDLQVIIQFMYKGFVLVPNRQLASFMRSVAMLRVRGLCVEDEHGTLLSATLDDSQQPGPSGLGGGSSGLGGGPSGFGGGTSGLCAGPSGLSGPSGLGGGPSGNGAGPSGLSAGPSGLGAGPSGLCAGPSGLGGGPSGSIATSTNPDGSLSKMMHGTSITEPERDMWSDSDDSLDCQLTIVIPQLSSSDEEESETVQQVEESMEQDAAE